MGPTRHNFPGPPKPTSPSVRQSPSSSYTARKETRRYLYKFTRSYIYKLIKVKKVRSITSVQKTSGYSPVFGGILPRHFRLRNDLYCVRWGVKLYPLTHAAPSQLVESTVDRRRCCHEPLLRGHEIHARVHGGLQQRIQRGKAGYVGAAGRSARPRSRRILAG